MIKKIFFFSASILIFFEVVFSVFYWIAGDSVLVPSEDNRVLSGYTVFKNNPKFIFDTLRQNQSNPVEVTADENGFISDEAIFKDKGPGIIRVFLLGSSAMLGSVQSGSYKNVFDYTKGADKLRTTLYSYKDSIPGHLKSLLGKEFPNYKIQVVNASTIFRKMHQSFLHYLERISAFSPDAVVNMEGFNDVKESFLDGTPYPSSERYWVPFYVERRERRSGFIYKYSGIVRIFRDVQDLIFYSKAGGNKPEFDYKKMREKYNNVKGVLQKNAHRYFQILNHYMSALKSDGVDFLFMLQPALWYGGGKELSKREQAFSEINSFGHDWEMVVRHFFPDYLTGELEKTVTQRGHLYRDLNKEFSNLGSGIEIFTDYTHLTLEGNRRVGKIIFSAILPRLKAKFPSNCKACQQASQTVSTRSLLDMQAFSPAYLKKTKLYGNILLRSVEGNILMESQAPPGGVFFYYVLDPAKRYSVRVQGQSTGAPVTLRMGKDDSQKKWLGAPNGEKEYAISGTKRLELLIYSDKRFRYALSGIFVRPMP